jgi:hypothetical protein
MDARGVTGPFRWLPCGRAPQVDKELLHFKEEAVLMASREAATPDSDDGIIERQAPVTACAFVQTFATSGCS